jgi:hypothetical protein
LVKVCNLAETAVDLCKMVGGNDPKDTHGYVSLKGRNAAYCGPPVEIISQQEHYA